MAYILERKSVGKAERKYLGIHDKYWHPGSPRSMVRKFKKKLTSIGLRNIRFHDLRHTTASLLLEKNVYPKIVSELLGHSTVTLTLNTYSHIINPMSGVAAEVMDEIVGQ